MAWQEDEPSFVSSVLAAGLAAEQPDRADNPCFGGLFPDRRPSTQETRIAELEKQLAEPVAVKGMYADHVSRLLMVNLSNGQQIGIDPREIEILPYGFSKRAVKPKGVPKVEQPVKSDAELIDDAFASGFKALWGRLVAHWTWIWEVGY